MGRRERLWAVGESAGHEEDAGDLGVARIVGACADMCPESERAVRERLNDLASFERVPQDPARTSRHLAVKKFNRTQRGVSPHDVRPLPVLRATMAHLLSVLATPGQSLAATYSFLWDRFRAVRQEIVMQGISGRDAVDLLIPMVRFHVAAAYAVPLEFAAASSSERQPSGLLQAGRGSGAAIRPCTERGPRGAPGKPAGIPLGSESFDAHLNLSFLSQCIVSLMHHLASMRAGALESESTHKPWSKARDSPAVPVSEGGATSAALEESLERLALNDLDCSSVEAEAWSYYVLLNLGPLGGMNAAALPLALSAIPRRVWDSPSFRVARDAVKFHSRRNYIQFFRLAALKGTCASALQLCLLRLHAREMVQQTLMAVHGSGISQYPVPLADVSSWIHICEKDLEELAKGMGFTLVSQGSSNSLVPKAPLTPTLKPSSHQPPPLDGFENDCMITSVLLKEAVTRIGK